jgi:hypothetical protein
MGILFLLFLKMIYVHPHFPFPLRNILTIFPLMEAYLEHHKRYCFAAEALDGLFFHQSQYTPLAPNKKERLLWLLIIHKATKWLTAIMRHYRQALRLLYYGRYVG